ncbi:MAG: flagellar hook-basal body protein, partial [Armatimonadota bacterium]|nr:flagellar hook-basal body protein [Armatimonadota bacterium]
GVYTAASGMLASQAAQDTIAQNLANASTIGYKEDIPRFESFQAALASRLSADGGASVGTLGSGAGLKDETTNFADGSLQKSGNPLDVALTGDAALVLQTPQGLRLSRDGSLSMNVQGTLIQTDTNAPVLGANNQPIQIPAKAKDIVISPSGEITVDKVSVGRLRMASLSTANGAVKTGDNEFSVTSLRPASATATVRQGYLEMSNVNIVKEMVNMITAQRAYETNQKMLQSEDDATDKSVNEVSKV